MGKYTTLKNILRLTVSILLLVCFGMMFFNQVRVTGVGKLNFINSYFGEHGTFIPFIGYVLMLICAGLCFGLINVNVLEEQKRVVYYVISAVLVVASLLVFIEGAIITARYNQDGVSARLLAPPIIAGILSFISALLLSFVEISGKEPKQEY